MAPLRLRHPKGVSTIDVDLDNPETTVEELQSIIFSSTEISPSRQDLKSGYPPRSLTLVPELPVSSLGIKRGDQLMVNEIPGPSSSTAAHAAAALGTSRTMQFAMDAPTRGATKASVGSGGLDRVSGTSQGRAPVSSGPDSIRVSGGWLVHRVVPDDNSCLFASVALVFEQDIGKAQRLRQVAADAIRKDSVTWSEAVLGHPREQYISTILNPNSWGGAIELSIFSLHYQAEISSIDVETGRVDRFGSQHSYSNRAILLYSGIHYDAVSLSPIEDAPPDFHETLFSVASDDILDGAGKLAAKLRAKGMFTNTGTFDLKCQTCGKGLKGEKGARSHARETGHVDFGEY